MLNNKTLKIMILIIVLAVPGIFTSSCYQDDGDAVVTIHLERNDLAVMGIKPEHELSIIDTILNFFSTRAEAGGWQPTKTIVILKITSGCFDEMTFTIPPTSTNFSTTLPSGCDTTIKITSTYDDTFMTYTYQKNWGGQINVVLSPGEQELTIQILPMAFISGWNTVGHTVGWAEPSGSSAYTISSYKIYRSTNIDGKYNFIGSTTNSPFTDNAIGGTNRYYYKLTTLSKLNDNVVRESIPNDAKTWP